MDQVVAIRPFVPAKDLEISKAFYRALKFETTHEDDSIAIFQQGGFGFILQQFYVKEQAENFMMHMMLRDVSAWWQSIDMEKLVADFGIPVPKQPAMQSWGLKVGFIVDPTGVLWHIAEQRAQ